jgi:hypothetical protein
LLYKSTSNIQSKFSRFDILKKPLELAQRLRGLTTTY